MSTNRRGLPVQDHNITRIPAEHNQRKVWTRLNDKFKYRGRQILCRRLNYRTGLLHSPSFRCSSPSSSPLRPPNSSFRRRRSLLPSQPAAAALPRKSTTTPTTPTDNNTRLLDPPPPPALDSPADDHLLASIERRLFDVTTLSSSLAIPTLALSSSCSALASSASPARPRQTSVSAPWTACLMLHRSNHVHNSRQL
jgi:hypothetical protein